MCYKNTQIISGGCQVTAPARVNTLRHHITYMSIILCEMTRLPRKIFFLQVSCHILIGGKKEKEEEEKKAESWCTGTSCSSNFMLHYNPYKMNLSG